MIEKAEITGSIVTYNNIDTIDKCISSILKHSSKYVIKLFVIDNGSTDGTIELIQENYPQIILIKNLKNEGFGKGHNQIIPYLNEGYHFIINPDIYFREDVIADLVDYMRVNPDIGVLTPKILNPDGSEQYLPQRFPRVSYVLLSKLPLFHFYRKKYTREKERTGNTEAIEFCTGCFFCIKNEIFKRVDGFCDDFFMYFEDADLSKRLETQTVILYYPLSKVFHQWNRDNTKSCRGRKRYLKSMKLYFNRWGWRI